MPVRYVAAILLAAALGGCAATDWHVVPGGKDAPTLTGYKVERGLFDWEHYSVEAIDDKRVRQGLVYGGAVVPADRTYALAPGTHKVLVRGFFNRAWRGGGPYEASVVLAADFAAGTAYQLRGEIAGDLVRIWVAKASTGESMSAAAAEPYRVYVAEPGLGFFYIGPMFRW